MDTQSRSAAAAAAIEEGMWKGNRERRGGTMWLKRHTLPAGWLNGRSNIDSIRKRAHTQTVNSRQLKSSNTVRERGTRESLHTEEEGTISLVEHGNLNARNTLSLK